jgi:formate dehydrogenase formation protein
VTDPIWTLDRVAAARPELAPLARFHGELAAASRTSSAPPILARFAGPPALHWMEGRALLDVCDLGSLAPGVAALFGDLARTAAAASPRAGEAVREILDAVAGPGFDWTRRMADFRAIPEDLPHAALFRFLLLRTLCVPATALAREFSAPHAERWRRARCPWCGVPAAAAVAGAGAGRTLLCILCGGRWAHEGLACIACGEQRRDTQMFLADRALGPASLEGCGTCGHAIKTFAAVDLPDDAPVALEILTVHLDVVGETDGLARDPAALAAIFPPP